MLTTEIEQGHALDREVFHEFLGKGEILVVDPVRVAAERLRNILVNLGADEKKITIGLNFDDAVKIMSDKKPDVVISEYVLGDGSAFDLFLKYREIRDDQINCLSIMVTSNTSQVHVARAAEEDVDAFIIKPYDTELIKEVLVEGTKTKINPSKYIKFVRQGMDMLLQGKPYEAIEILSEAKKMTDKPTLAHYYLGQADVLIQAMESAEDNYVEGLDHNEIHFKCLNSLFDILMEEKKYQNAYEVVKKLVKYFPANPERLSKILRLAIITENYEDIENYYNIFMDLEFSNEGLTRYISAGLVTLGKYFMGQGRRNSALDIFRNAAEVSNGKPIILRNIIEGLVDRRMFVEVEAFMERFADKDRETQDYRICDFLAGGFTGDVDASIDKGYKLVNGEMVSNRTVYKVLDFLLMASDRNAEAVEIRKKKDKIFGAIRMAKKSAV